MEEMGPGCTLVAYKELADDAILAVLSSFHIPTKFCLKQLKIPYCSKVLSM